MATGFNAELEVDGQKVLLGTQEMDWSQLNATAWTQTFTMVTAQPVKREEFSELYVLALLQRGSCYLTKKHKLASLRAYRRIQKLKVRLRAYLDAGGDANDFRPRQMLIAMDLHKRFIEELERVRQTRKTVTGRFSAKNPNLANQPVPPHQNCKSIMVPYKDEDENHG